MSYVVYVGAGHIGVPLATYQRYLPEVRCVALTEIGGQPHLLPLHGPVAGGHLVKQKNLRGDRVIAASDFLAAYGIDDFGAEREYAVHWVSESGALRIEGLHRTAVGARLRAG
jgi:hypothetical protein